MDKNDIIAILTDWNFWKKDVETGIRRGGYLTRLNSLLSANQIISITGPRRAGKSFIMRQFAHEMISQRVAKKNILLINFEDPRFDCLDAKALQKIYETYIEFLNPDKKPHVFLDEVQEVHEWEKWVRMMDELGKARIIISGSNAKLLSRELATLLTGRHVSLTIFPLSFREQLEFGGISADDKLELADKKIDVARTLNERIEFGGFPKVVLSGGKKEILLNYYDDMVGKDLIKRFNVRKTGHLKSLARFYLSNISSPVTFSSAEKFLNLSADTIEKFSSYFEESYLFFFVKRFSFKVKEQEKSPRKVYTIDTGLANAVGFSMSPNIGRLAESLVFLELAGKRANNAAMDIFYWKDAQHREVDFVVKNGNAVDGLIQVCWDISKPETRKREITALTRAMKEFGLNEGLIVTHDYEGNEEQDGKLLKFVPLCKWLLSVYG